MTLNKSKQFLRRRFFPAAVAVLMLPLMIILALQYRSLRALEQTLPLYRREALGQYLKAVTTEIADLYMTEAELTLAVPAGLIDYRQAGAAQADGARAAVARAAEYFKDKEFRGARRFFVAVATQREGAVFFYDPARQAMIAHPSAPEMRAINVAAAPYMIYVRTRTPLQPEPMGIDRDPEVPLIVKPILDEEKKIVGLAGMVIDQEWFRNEVVPQAIHRSLPGFFPEDCEDAIVTLRFYDDQLIYATQQTDELPPEATARFQPFFWNYALGIRMRHLSIAQWTRGSFVLNLSLSLAMTLVLAGGLVFAVRAATREMKLSQMKTDFVANVSHELRTPLVFICAFAELLKLGRIHQPDRVREYGLYIESQGHRLTRLLNNILDFSQIESGRKQYQFAPADLFEIAVEAVEACALRVEQSGHTIELEPPAQPMPRTMVDYEAMVTALLNLLDNAIKYSGEGQAIVVRLAAHGQFATLAVSDNGMGIPPGEQERIFEKFYRISTGMVHDVKGTGLGLAIVKHIVEAHRGKVTLDTEPGRGSTFTIHLPITDSTRPAHSEG